MEYQRAYAKIDLDAIEHNIALVKQKISPETKLMLVVKADAYGHGAVVIAKEFEATADYFGVAELNEALELRAAGIRKPILILGYTSPHYFESAVKNDITLTVFRYENAVTLSETAQALGKTAKVHFAVDTGMSRIGFFVSEEEADEAAKAATLPGILVEGIFSHFAKADSVDKTPSEVQRILFECFLDRLAQRGVCPPIRHLNNSAGILSFQNDYDMVREGIILYGLYPSEDICTQFGGLYDIHPAMELITHISHIKTLNAHQGIGYGYTYVTEKDVRVATVPVGYADGYPRALSNRGEVLIHGKRCPILGRVCMDQMMVDITDVPEAKTEDPVVLIGKDGNETISAEEVGEAAYSFNYELVCGIARRIPRIYTRGGLWITIITTLVYSEAITYV
ncbi:MAG: alanine racemase [Clostridia bacterium]|nr:alanine racemase [Clostridia bacterium]